MFIIQETTIEEPIAGIKFACDLNACKGACCTLPGGKGAPLLDSEIAEIQKAFPVVRENLSLEHLARIEEKGLFEGSEGDYTTPCYKNRACVFVTYENGIAKCSFEKAYLKGDISWRKPLSCHLFPLRVDRLAHDRIRFEFISECGPALDKGNLEDVYLSDFLKESLVRAYGEAWYKKFIDLCETVRSGKVAYEEHRPWLP
ncbi:MAG: DUF3109 family protein [Ignavibacteriales bacterium]|nr:DUF3109 family protein [Ignavibacteriales bacterium]